MASELLAVETIEETEIDPTQPGVSWAAIAAGAVAAAALSLLLVAFGAGLGLSAVSPWSDSRVSASTFSIGTGIYLCIVAVMSSAIGRMHAHENHGPAPPRILRMAHSLV